MKKLLLYIILFSYAIVMFKPVFPYVEDFIGHVLFYKQHVATVHYENGKYHVHAEVTKNAKEDNSNKPTPSSKKQHTQTEHVVVLRKTTSYTPAIYSRNYAFAKSIHLLAGNLSYNYRPPRV